MSNINTDKTGFFDFYTYSVFTHKDMIHSLIKMGQYLISDEQVGCDGYFHYCVWCQMYIVSHII